VCVCVCVCVCVLNTMQAVDKTVVSNYKIPTWRESQYAKNNIHTAKTEDIPREDTGNTHMHNTHTHA